MRRHLIRPQRLPRIHLLRPSRKSTTLDLHRRRAPIRAPRLPLESTILINQHLPSRSTPVSLVPSPPQIQQHSTNTDANRSHRRGDADPRVRARRQPATTSRGRGRRGRRHGRGGGCGRCRLRVQPDRRRGGTLRHVKGPLVAVGARTDRGGGVGLEVEPAGRVGAAPVELDGGGVVVAADALELLLCVCLLG